MSRKHLQGSNGNISSFRGRGLILFFILATLAAVVPGPAAANDDPVISGNTANYSGNQQPDPINPQATISTNIYTINVNNLTSDVGSVNTSVAISLTHSGAEGKDQGDKGYDSQALTLNYDGGSHSLISKDVSADVETTGGKGHSGGDNQVNNQRGGDGGDGGTGGTVNSSGVLTGVTITTTSGAIQALGTGISASSTGGNAGYGGNAGGVENQYGGAGGSGGDAGAVSVTTHGAIQSAGIGIQALSTGGKGGYGGDADTDALATGGAGGAGGAGGTVSVTTYGAITTTGVNNEYGIQATSQGGSNQGTESNDKTYGQGGQGGGDKGLGGDGGDGGAGGQVNVTTHNTITTSGGSSHGIYAQSLGGAGGTGGEAKGTGGCKSGAGGAGGAAGSVAVTNNDWIKTSGANAYGINAQSTGGSGGDGGECKAAGGNGNSGGTGGNGGSVTVTANAGIWTQGANAIGINAASTGGSGGDGGSAKSLADGNGGDGGAGGAGGSVKVDNYIEIWTSGLGAGIYAQSLGGAGGAGALGGSSSGAGGDGGAGGTGGSVTITNHQAGTTVATITTNGANAHGIYAQSSGGAGGAGGTGKGISGNGGAGGTGGAATGSVQVTNDGTITTNGANAHGIYAQSSGGAGGAGAAGLAAGGNGGAGGAGGAATGSVQVTNNGSINFTGANSYGINAQSTGGGGGDGGDAKTGTEGNGGDGGAGGAATGSIQVTNTNIGTIISSAGYDIYAKSSGGAGGTGGLGAGTSGSGGAGGAGGTGGGVTVNNSGTLSYTGNGNHAVAALSNGGAGGAGGTGGGVKGAGGHGGAGGSGGSVSVTNYGSGSITTTQADAYGICAQSFGGAGGHGGDGDGAGGNGGSASAGGTGGSVSVTNYGAISTSGAGAFGINAESIGGAGANGGSGYGASGVGGNAGNGGASSQVTVQASADITTNGQTYAINAVSQAGAGGKGGEAGGVNANGGNAGAGGNSTTTDGSNIVSVTVDSGVTLKGGILAASIAGAGGKAHSSIGVTAEGGDGGAGGAAGGVQVQCNGNITVNGVHGILAQSIAGIGGAGGDAAAAGDASGKGGAGAVGGAVTVKCYGDIGVTGDQVHGILAQSQGGSGGSGGNAYGGIAVPENAGASAAGGAVNVTMTGSITTSGADSCGILAQSLGGSGGGGGDGYGIISWGQAASAGADGGAVTVNTGSATANTATISTQGASSIAILAQSIGGGGGYGGSSGSLIINLGGSGAAGGDGGNASVINYLALTTAGDYAYGIQSQSLGGGGGNGGGSVSIAAGAGISMGGSGGPGGDGGQAGVTNSGAISTSGASAYGIFAQSVGGGGGSGGYAVTAGVGVGVIGIGGSGGSGGDGSTVSVTNSGSISTSGASAYGILAQSVGGGGGAGGYSITAGVPVPIGAFLIGGNVASGGSGDGGGDGNKVSVTSSNTIGTSGDHAAGILAQSIGGGGGNGGYAVAAGVSTVQAGIGGSGGKGGAGGEVDVGSSTAYCSSDITTTGVNAQGILAQSVGGGGGNGGWSVAAGVGINASIGGSGGSGGDGGAVNVFNSGSITTGNDLSQGILAQSIGGGGGNGGFSVAAGITPCLEASFSLGGGSGDGGDGGKVTATSTGKTIGTSGDHAVGILAQSIGGGGGNGGWSVDAGVGINAGIGGSGGNGGAGGEVDIGSGSAYCSSKITTAGVNAQGILAQSVGGGGGNGGWNVTGGVGITAGFGGSGGSGGDGGVVNVYNSGAITTTNDTSQGILAQSVGGGGGNGGFSVAGNITPIVSASFTLGGKGGGAGDGQKVQVFNNGSISTGSITTNSDGTQTVLGNNAHGILAQSVGGGGGNGGWAGSGSASFSLGPDAPVSVSLSLSMGGAGGSGNDGGNVTVNNYAPENGSSSIRTLGDHAYGILAQSIGGGGGAGGGSVAASMSFSGEGSFNMSCPIAIGGHGGTGGDGGQVGVTNQNAIQTSGYNSLGIMAQSIGGGGGDGGASLTGSLSGSAGAVNFSPQITIGGDGGDGGDGNTVNVTNTGAITTTGVSAIGIEAQSIGGGGGNGNGAYSGNVLLGSSNGFNADITVGGKGGNGGAGNNVTVTNGDQQNALIGTIQTSGHLAPGILAQSIGGGGGNGGQSVSLNYSVKTGGAASDSDSGTSVTISPTFNIGGNGGSGGNNKNALVTVENYANISTAGARSYGIQAQCIGGGGGNGGGVFTLALGPDLSNPQNTDPPATNLSGNVTVGGNGGTGGDAGQVKVDNYGAISTQGAYSYGIFAQSVGGGGGAGGSINDLAIVEALSKVLNHSPSNDLTHGETISVGGKGGAAGDGNTVTVNNYGAIGTSGDCAHGIFAQSVGGGGGDGGVPTLGLTVPSGDWSDWQTWLIPSEGLSFEVGGAGGAAGIGNTVTVTNSGAITTSGIGAMGIYAQSVGGGGGVASYDQSNGSSGTGTNLLPGAIAIGGKGGSAGDGGTVQVTNSGVIQTSGRGACGIYTQSIGGGGGNASVMGGPWEGISWLQYFGFGINIGAGGGDGGNGGTVTVTNTADITTQGDNANGIFAQSIGGQGGAGSVITQISQGFLWNGSTAAGVAGTGGTVTVSQTGNITTYGNDAHGIVAQSSAGKDTAGNVTVTFNNPPDTALSGNIITSGLGSCGIVAQSLGLGGNGQIEIDIYQHGPNTGLVQGGHSGTVTNSNGSTTTYNAYGVLIMDGQNNTLLNYGSISTLDGATGTAVMVQASYGSPSWGDLTINNYGTITGSVNQGTQAASAFNQDQSDPSKSLKLPGGQSAITFNNYQGGTYNAGPTINLGGGTLSNSGLLSLGTLHSTLTGNYTQTNTGIFQTTVNPDGTIGQLNVSGMAQLAGTLQVLKGTGLFKDGTSSAFLVGKTSGNFSNLILPADTSLVNFSVQYTGASASSGDQAAAPGNAVQIVSHVKSHTTVANSSTQTAVGGYLDQLLAGNPTGNIALILEELQKMAPSQFPTAFESLNPGIYGANTDTTFSITRQYTRTLQQRLAGLRAIRWEEAAPQALSDRPFPLLAFNGSNASLGQVLGRGQEDSGWVNDRLGFWLEGFGQWGSQGSVDHVSGYNYGGAGTGVGLDYAFTKNLIIGANFGYSYSNLRMDNSVGNGQINSLYGSLYGTYFTERSYVEGVLSYGNHRYDNSRRVSIGALQSSNQSSHTGNAFSVLTEAGYKFPVQQWNLQPFASLNYCNLTEGRFEESGALATMQVDGRSTNSLVSELGTQVDRPIRTSKGILVPMVKVGWQHDFGVSKNSVPFTLVGAPVGVTVTLPRVSQDRAAVKAGLTFKARGGVTSSIQYMGEVGEKTQNHGVIGQVRIAF